MQQFQVQKNVLGNHRITESVSEDVTAGKIKVKVDKFAFTANNITYGVAGEMFGYWSFFPAVNADDEWGVLPVWGFAEVISSTLDDLPIGDRLFGYFPPATELIMTPVDVTHSKFIDGSSHRAELPPGYNVYRRVNAEPDYNPEIDDVRTLLLPLHKTSFCLWDYLQDNNWFDAEQVIVLSASSKTSIGLGYALHNDTDSKKSVGMTSEQNLEFVKSLGYYDQSLSYSEIDTLDPSIATAIVDMSGNQQVLGKLHQHFGEQMTRCINVGATHWKEPRNSSGINTDRSEVFFAPGHIQQRMKDWGVDEFERRSSEFLTKSFQSSVDWMKVTRINGLDGLAEVYPSVCDGDVPAEQGLVVKL